MTFELPDELKPVMTLSIIVFNDNGEYLPSISLDFDDDINLEWNTLDALYEGIGLAQVKLNMILDGIINDQRKN